MTEKRGQRTVPGSKPPVMRPGWLDPRQEAEHPCQFPAAERVDIGRRWRCECGKTWRLDSTDPMPTRWTPIPPNPGRRGDQGLTWGTVDDPKPYRWWWPW